MIIQHNFMAINAKRNNNIASKKLKSSIEKLASGFSINRAADDAARLSISEKMRSQIRGLNQASRNIDDGISYVQVAEGGLNEIQDILNRITELSVKSANDTNNNEDRLAIDTEVQELKVEISKILTDSEFNGKKIWDENPNGRVKIGTEQLPAVTSNSLTGTGTLNEVNKGAIPSTGSFKLNADESGIIITWDAYNGKSYASDIIEWPDDLVGSHSFQLSDYVDFSSYPEVTGIDFNYSYHVIEAATLGNVIDSINGATVGCYPYNSVNTTAYSKDGGGLSGISFTSSINYPVLLASHKNLDEYDDVFIEGSTGGIITNDNLVNDPTVTGSSDKWVFEFQMPNIGTVKATSNSTYYYSNWRDPDQKWWHTTNGYDYTNNFAPTPSDGSLDSVNASLVNDGLDLVNDTITGGTIVVSFNLTADTAFVLPNGSSYNNVGRTSMYINVSSIDTLDTVFEKLNKLSGIDIAAGNETTNEPSNTYYYARTNNIKKVLIESPIYENQMVLNIQCGANSNEAINIHYKSLNNHILGVNDISLLTRNESEKAMDLVNIAQEIVMDQRSRFGSYQNQMIHARSNVNNMEENIQSGESRIRDTDMAAEMVEVAKNKILMQAAQSIITQANQQPEMVLSLLK